MKAMLTPRYVLQVCGVLAGVLLLLSLLSLTLGAVSIPAREVFTALWESVWGSPNTLPTEHQVILLSIRLPRILLAIVVGAALAVAGAGYQALLRNPLADPYVLGVSSGAALGSILSLALGWRFLGLATPAAAFLGAVLTIAAVYFLGQRPAPGGAELSPYTLLLAGVIMASFLAALITFLMNFLSGRDLRGVTFWLMGDLTPAGPLRFVPLGVTTLIALAAIYIVSGDLNLLLAGETEAAALGVNVRRTKLIVYLAASLATGLAVSVSGSIGYVGLLVPHLVRLWIGSDYRLLIPTAALSGAIVLVGADTLARTVIAPTELPVGAVTAVVGAPVFIYLLRRPQTEWFRSQRSSTGPAHE